MEQRITIVFDEYEDDRVEIEKNDFSPLEAIGILELAKERLINEYFNKDK